MNTAQLFGELKQEYSTVTAGERTYRSTAEEGFLKNYIRSNF